LPCTTSSQETEWVSSYIPEPTQGGSHTGIALGIG